MRLFVTDKCQALMTALSKVFPDSLTFLCSWNMRENFRAELKKGVFLSSECLNTCVNALEKMINSINKEDFHRALATYTETATNRGNLKTTAVIGKSNTVEFKPHAYINNNRLPIKHKRAGYLVNKHQHFGCTTTTQRVEGNHAALKA